MLTASRSMSLSSTSSPALPEIPALEDLYKSGVKLRRGQVIMIAGRSGSQKSGFALFIVESLGLPVLYFSADMRPSTASSRILGIRMGLGSEDCDAIFTDLDQTKARECLSNLRGSQVQFCFDSPITWYGVEQELEAYVDVHNRWPEVIVFDNLMDFEAGDADYAAQMSNMQLITELARETEATVFVLHHATDKSQNAKSDPFKPPSRSEVKGGLSEKPELSLSVALDPNTQAFRVACIKQREGRSDPTAERPVTLMSRAELTRFEKWTGGVQHGRTSG